VGNSRGKRAGAVKREVKNRTLYEPNPKGVAPKTSPPDNLLATCRV